MVLDVGRFLLSRATVQQSCDIMESYDDNFSYILGFVDTKIGYYLHDCTYTSHLNS